MAQPQTVYEKTEYAKIYSHPVGVVRGVDHAAIANILPLKSGLTPNELGSTSPVTQVERYQFTRFHGTNPVLLGVRTLIMI